MRRFLLISPYLPPTGVSSVEVLNLSRHLPSFGWESSEHDAAARGRRPSISPEVVEEYSAAEQARRFAAVLEGATR